MTRLTKAQEELAERNKHISTTGIKEDIADTQAEIAVMKREIKERENFIKKLQIILEVRTKKPLLK